MANGQSHNDIFCCESLSVSQCPLNQRINFQLTNIDTVYFTPVTRFHMKQVQSQNVNMPT